MNDGLGICIIKNHFIKTFLFIHLFLITLFSQTSELTDTLKIDTFSVSTNYSKSLLIHNFSNSIIYNDKLIDDMLISLKNNYTSTYLEGNFRNIRDNNNLKLNLNRKFNDLINPQLAIRSNISSDNRNIGLSDISENVIALGNEFSFNEYFKLTSLVGLKNDKQLSKIDNGYLFSINSKLNSFNLDDYFINGIGNIYNEKLDERENYTRQVSVNANKQFTEFINNKLKVDFYLFKKDFYFYLDSVSMKFYDRRLNIETRKENTWNINYILNYEKIFNFINFDLAIDFQLRDIDKTNKYKLISNQNQLFNENIKESKISINPNFKLYFNNFISDLRLSYSGRNENHYLSNPFEATKVLFDQKEKEAFEKNNFYTKYQISSENILSLNKYDYLGLLLNYSLLRYDTPSELNYDDRDEQFIGLKMYYFNRFTNSLTGYASLELLLNHLVYIFSQRSSNNNWNRIFRIFVNSNYTNEDFKNKSYLELTANYVVYDYSDLVSGIRSFSFRQFSLIDTLEYKISSKVLFGLETGIKLSEQGFLNWNQFKVKPQRYLEEGFLDLVIRYKFVPKNYFNFGIRLFIFNEYIYNQNNLNLKQSIMSYGPTFETRLIFNNFILFGKLWYELIKTSKDDNYKNINMNIQLDYRL